MKTYFITGTDTDCGKTFSTCALLDYFKPKAIALKPVATGCLMTEQGLVSEDALAIQNHCNLNLNAINPWRFSPAVSPHIAAKAQPLSVPLIADYCLDFTSDQADYLFIEGAGGLMAPLTDTASWIDFLKITALPVILVVGIKTGCINHALLTQSVIKLHQIPFAGWIANQIDPQVLAYDENLATLKAQLKAPLLGIIRYRQPISSLALDCL